MIREILDFFWPQWCPCGEEMIGGKCVLDIEIGEEECGVEDRAIE